MHETIKLLHTRRSVLAINMVEPGPSKDDLKDILRAGMRVPDHGKLAPWRFVVIEGEARRALGGAIREAFVEDNPQADEERIDFEADRFLRAPLVVCVVSSVVASAKVPEWEQILSAGAVCQNILIAATAKGYASQWLTEWYGYDPRVLNALGLEAEEKVAGFIYMGTAAQAPTERPRPEFDDVVSVWSQDDRS